MSLLSNLFSDRGKRASWEAGLSWFRLRYTDVPTQAVNLLSRPEACGRVALYYRPADPVSQLYLGLPEPYGRLLARMAADFGFSVTPKPPDVVIPPPRPMTAVADLPWDRDFVAQITNEFAFVSLESGSDRGPYLPRPPSRGGSRKADTWTLPVNPPPGLRMNPSWNDYPPHPTLLDQTGRNGGPWPLGWTATGVPVHAGGRINLYGRQEAAADWLIEQVARVVTHDPAKLVVIDGAGDLVPRLKRKTAVTRLLGKGLAYVDIDSPPLGRGFNPLAAVPGETEAMLLGRWGRWFEGMTMIPEAVQLLTVARQDGVGDIPALGKWLEQVRRQAQSVAKLDQAGHAVSSLSAALNRLTADSNLREWLEWPDNRFGVLPEGAVFFSCKNLGWDRQQLLRMMLLGAVQVEGVRLVVHGFPWKMVRTSLDSQEQMVVSNGPLMEKSARVLVSSKPAAAQKLSKMFLGGDGLLTENLEILSSRQAILLFEGEIQPVSWVQASRG